MAMHRPLLVLSLLPATALAGHCYGITDCSSCTSDTRGSECAWCDGSCQMAWDSCSSTQITLSASCVSGPPPPPLPGNGPFFEDASHLLAVNPAARNYGVAVTDTNADGIFEFVVAGYGSANLVYQWDAVRQQYMEIAPETIKDATSRAIGVAACDIDGDGYEELYVLNTDQYQGVTLTSDRLYDRNADGTYTELFQLPTNANAANFVAGRSCACVDRTGNGRYGIMVANYGGPMRLFETSGEGSRTVVDVASAAGVALTTGGRALVSGPIVSTGMDIFANNEGYVGGRRLEEEDGDEAERARRQLSHRANFFFVNQGDGTFNDQASAVGLLDNFYTGRGTTLFDANHDGLIDIVYGNWNAQHRLWVQSRDSSGAASFTDVAPVALATASPIRTVIVADWDNDGFEEIFWNNIPGANRLFRKLPADADWTMIDAGAATDAGGYGTGGAVGDFDGDGRLELVVSHGESASQPLSLFRPTQGASNNWLRVKPLTRSGAPARGAVVTLSGASSLAHTQLKVIDAGSGYLCQMEPIAHFGLGTSTSVATVRVRWPGNVCVTMSAPAINMVHTVPYPQGACSCDATANSCTSGTVGVSVTPAGSPPSPSLPSPSYPPALPWNHPQHPPPPPSSPSPSPSLPLSPPPPSASTSPPPLSSSAMTHHFVRFSTVVESTLANFDDDAYKRRLADAIDGVAVSRVTLTVTEVATSVRLRALQQAASHLNVTATVVAADASAASAVRANLVAMATPQALSDALGVTIVSVSAIEAVSQASGIGSIDASAPNLSATESAMGLRGIVGVVVGVAVLAAICCLLLVCRLRPQVIGGVEATQLGSHRKMQTEMTPSSIGIESVSSTPSTSSAVSTDP